MGVPLAAAGAAGTAVSAYGKYEEGQATSEADSYKAAVANNNAAIATRDSKLTIQAGETAAVNKGLQTRAAVGAEKANQGASGVDVNTGSAVATRAGTAEIGMLDALTTRSNAAKDAYSQEVQAENYTTQGVLDKFAGEQAETAGAIGAAGTLLSGASTVGSNYAQFQSKYG